jgi:IS30 family transposase
MSSKMADYHIRLRAEIGEEAYLARLAAVRSHRRKFGHFELDYVDDQGRTGSEIATEAGRAGRRARTLNKQGQKQ